MVLKRKLQKETIKQNFDKSTKILNEIIDSQRPIHDKTGLGYNQKLDELGSSSKIGKGDKRSYVDIARENCEPSKENPQKEGTSRHEEDEHTKREAPVSHNNDIRKQAPSRRSVMPRYQICFLVYVMPTIIMGIKL